jgi:predicted CXXCH cytochrome family protein
MGAVHLVVRHAGAFAAGFVLVASSAPAQVTGIRNTKHNLSATSANVVRATSESEICVFCHTPHGGRTDAPLWNRNYGGAPYTPYTSPSLQGAAGQPNGYSKLCLSCHDGTIALGDVLNTPNASVSSSIQMTGVGGGGTMPAGNTHLGTNLANDHPVSFVYDQVLQRADGELRDPATVGTGDVPLYEGATPGVANTVQCTSCHDPHTDARPKFLRRSPRGQTDNLCLSCHNKPGWVGSTHNESALVATIGGVTGAVSEHACMSCHAPHAVDGAERLLRNGATAGVSAIEQTCYQCHTSGGPAQNIQTEFAKPGSRHPVENSSYSGRHRPVFITQPSTGLPEGVLLQPGQPAPDARFTDQQHVECVDCHNPHRAVRANSLEGMRGIDLNGSVLANVLNDSSASGLSQQYAVCFRCHGDSYATALPVVLTSGLAPTNKRIEFQTSNSAFHPIGAPGRNTSANLNAQLMPNGLSVQATIRCTDCHNSEAYAATTGKISSATGSPSGPHGSANPSLLRANYRSTLGVNSYNANNFALCFRCHSSSALFGSSTNFYDDIDGKDNLHDLHVRDRADKTGAICKSCHYNIHSNAQTTTTQYNVDGATYLTPPTATPTRNVNFHPSIRGIGGRARPEWWFNSATRERRCYLQCHTSSGATGGTIMNGTTGSGGKKALYRPASGDVQ